MSNNKVEVENYLNKTLEKAWKDYSDKPNKDKLFKLLFDIQHNLKFLNYKVDYLLHMVEEKENKENN